MTAAEWGLLRRVFAKAAPLRGPERDDYLRRLRHGEAFRREVESLLEQHDKSENLFGVLSSVGGKTLGHYEVLEQIGAGGMALVYRARDRRLHRIVALKVLPAWGIADPSLRHQLRKEAECISALAHPNIVTIYEIGEQEGVDYLVMEYVAGKTLDRCIPSRGLPLPDALHFAVQIADAVASAHAREIVHGDLTPANIMVTSDHRIKLLDFGLGRALRSSDHARPEGGSSRLMGTPAYMAPECLRKNPVMPDQVSEVFTFGILLSEMLTGKHPFRPYGRDVRSSIRNRQPIALPSGVPAFWVSVVTGCLEKKRQRRLQSMRDVLAILTNCPKAGRPPASKRLAGTKSSRQEADIRGALERLQFQRGAESRQAVEDLTQLLRRGVVPAVSESVISALRDFILTPIRFSAETASQRELRKAALHAIRAASRGGLRRSFKDRDFEHLDLYEMNFESESLDGFSFAGCFLAGSTFEGADLRKASFSQASVRNVNFAGADLADADFADADWFNASGLTERQLISVSPESLIDCPPTVPAMHATLKVRYAFPFESWPARMQAQLRAAWNEYLSPGGLKEMLSRRQTPRSRFPARDR